MLGSRFLRKRYAVGLCVLLVCFLVARSLNFWPSSGADVIPDRVPAVRADIERVIKAVGSVHPRRAVEVGTLANGQLRSVKVKLGEEVRKGQLLAEMDPQIPENEVLTRQATRDEARAAKQAALVMLTYWKGKRDRTQFLHGQDAASLADASETEAQWQRQKADVAGLGAALLRAESELGTAKKRLSDTRIVAPIDGQVLDFRILEGQIIVASQTAQVIMVLADMRRVTVHAEVSEADVSRIQPGQKAYFSTLAEPGKRIDGAIRAIEPNATLRANDTSRAIYYTALLDVENQDAALRAHMTADVTIVEGDAKDALTVPGSAVWSVPGVMGETRTYVFFAESGRIGARRVVLGLRNDTHVSVAEGVSDGELIVGDASALFDQDDVRLSAKLSALLHAADTVFANGKDAQ